MKWQALNINKIINISTNKPSKIFMTFFIRENRKQNKRRELAFCVTLAGFAGIFRNR
jgi:hypothetical protein